MDYTSRLPSEILDAVYGALLDFDVLGRAPGKRALMCAALTCLRWREPAQRYLFEVVDFTHFITANVAAQHWLQSAGRSRHRLKHLYLSTGRLQEAVLSQAVAVCAGLISLSLDPQGFKELTAVLWNPIFKDLKHLEWRNTPTEWPSRPHSPVIFPFHLESLTLQLETDVDPQFLSALFRSSVGLRSLTLVDPLPSDAKSMSLALSSTPLPALRHLSLTSRAHGAPTFIEACVPFLSTVHHLELARPQAFSSTLLHTATFLERMTLRFRDHAEAVVWLDHVVLPLLQKPGSLPQLKEIVVRLDRDHIISARSSLPFLRACQEREVRVMGF